MGKMGSEGHETSDCPCEKCIYKKSCKEECDSFHKYTMANSPNLRAKLLTEFITMQDLSIEHFKRLTHEQRTSH